MMTFLFVLLFLLLELSSGQDDQCSQTRCSENSPIIRFPFREKGSQPAYCGYPGFDLSCSPDNSTILQLPSLVKLRVYGIDYGSKLIHVNAPDDCFARQLQKLNFSASPFKFAQHFVYNFTLFSCPSGEPDSLRYRTCLGTNERDVYAVYSDFFIYYAPLLSCKKMYNISSIPSGVFDQPNDVQLTWPERICEYCEAQRQYCRFKNNSREHGIECFGSLKPPSEGNKKPPIIAGVVVGSFLVAVAIVAMYFFQRSIRIKKEDQVKIEKFLEDYRALKPSRYSYADIKKITDQFKHKLGEGGYGTVYKGQLANDVHVAVKILNNSKGNGEEFINEVGIISKIHHIHVVRLVGYCADGFRRALIYEFLPNSLENFLSSDCHKGLLGWKKLEAIALGIAKGIEYLHQGCDQRILHFDIKPQNVLLDHNLNPKISDFGQAKLCSKDRSIVSMTTARGTIGYVAPEVFSRNFGNVSYKSDVYSFGMLLLEMVGGRSNSGTENAAEVYFPEWIYSNLDRGEGLGIPTNDDGDARIAKKLAIVGLWCIQWYPMDRPSTSGVVHMLEGDGDTLVMPPNPFTSGTMAGRPSVNNHLEAIAESG